MRLDKSHPIGRHLVGCWFPYRDPGMINLANNNELSAIGVSATSLRKLENGGMRLDNACSIQTNNTQPAIAADGDYFWFIRFRLRALINTNHTVFGNRLGGTSSPLQFVKFYESGFSYYNNATGPTMTYPRAAEAERNVLVVKRGGDWKMYLNGELHATATASVSMDPNPIYIGSGDTGAFYENTNMRFYYGMHGPVAPSPAQVASLFANPEQVLYKSINDYYYIPPPASGFTINCTQESLTLTENASDTDLDFTISSALESLSLTDNNGTVALGFNIAGNLESLTLTENASDTDLDFTISGTQEILQLTDNNGTVSFGFGINANTESLTLTENASDTDLDFTISSTLETLTLTENASNTDLDFPINCSLESLDLTDNNATVLLDSGFQISAGLESLELTDINSSITFTGSAWTIQSNDGTVWIVQANDSSNWTVQ